MKLLLVEDQVMAAEYLAKGLAENGFVVDVACDGVNGLNALLANEYDLALLDVMLPSMDGWTVFERLRQSGKTTPVMFLTACDEMDDRIRGLLSGADDYLIKPFPFNELLNRIKGIMHRHTSVILQGDNSVSQCFDLRLDRSAHTVSRNGREIILTQKEFLLLDLLIRHQGEILSPAMVAEQVWNINCVAESGVTDMAIQRLRSKIDDGYDLKLLHTLRGAGYTLDNLTKL